MTVRDSDMVVTIVIFGGLTRISLNRLHCRRAVSSGALWRGSVASLVDEAAGGPAGTWGALIG